jgi:hypothetical protein
MLSAKGRLIRVLLVSVCAVTVTSATRAEHATIRLQINGPKSRQESFADHEPPVGGVNARPQFSVKAGTPLIVEFKLTNEFPHETIDGVTVRYFVVRTNKLGAKEYPDPKDGAVAVGTVNMPFKPKCKVGARFNLQIDAPGIYLLRVETQNTRSDHEHFSAIDLQIK